MRAQLRLHSLWGYPGSIPVGRPARHQWAKPWATAAGEQRPAPGARRAAAALGLGIGSGIANDSPGARVGVSGAGTGLGAAMALRRTSANSWRSGAR